MKSDLRILGTAFVIGCLIPPALGEEPQAASIADKMAGVTDELNRKVTGPPVQTDQKTIVRDLDALIASLEKQCEACRNGVKRNRPTRGMDDSRIGSGTGGIGELLNPADSGKDWGKLSSRERDRILQSMSEGFPPEYRTVLERYYRRLAEEKNAATTKENPPATSTSSDAPEGSGEKP